MPKFLAVHTLPAPVTIQEATPLAKKAKAANTAVDAYWVSSWLQLNEAGKIHKILCEWNAVDAQAVRRELAKVPEFPVDGIYPMAKIDSEDYR
jgi:hypothetical protein